MNGYFSTDLIDGKPSLSSTPLLHDIARGNVTGATALHKFGRNPSVGATEEVVWTGSSIYTYLSSAEVLQVSSDDIDDDGNPVDTGARTVTLVGLDGNYDEVTITITMNGTTSVPTTGTSFLRIYRAYVATAGSTGANEGTISIKNNAESVTLARIEPGMNQTEMAMWTVPADNTFYLTKIWASESGVQDTILTLFVRPDGGVFQNKFTFVLNGSVLTRTYDLPISFAEKSDVEIRATTGATGGDVAAGFDGWYE
jgi:hypothetical protein